MTSTAMQAQQKRRLNDAHVRAALQERHPEASPNDIRNLAKVVAIVCDVVGELPEAERREIVQDQERLRASLLKTCRAGRATSQKRKVPKTAGDVVHSRGSGLGKQITVVEGRERLDRYTRVRPLESWAGPTAGAGEIEHDLGIPRSTLSAWQQKGSVIGLLRGERKLAYPVEQFVDARPLEGIADVLKLTPDSRSAWLWLRQPHIALQGRLPLDVLKDGGKEVVVCAAERDFV